MYRTTERGFSRGAKVTLTVVTSLLAALVLVSVPSTDKAPYFYMFAAFCLIITFACVTWGRVRRVFGSIIGLTLFVISLFYLYEEITSGVLVSGSLGNLSVLNAGVFFILFGLPGITYAIKARFGTRKNPEPDKETRIHRQMLQKVRLEIMDALAVMASPEETETTEADEVMDFWADYIDDDWVSEFREPVFSTQEQEGLNRFRARWEQFVDSLPQEELEMDKLFGNPRWQELAVAASETLNIFNQRGRSPKNA